MSSPQPYIIYIKIINNIFLQTFKPKTSTLRFLKKTNKINLNLYKKFRLRSHVRNTLTRPFGSKLILSKGKGDFKTHTLKDDKKTFNNQLAAIVGINKVGNKFFSLLKYANGSITYTRLTHGLNLGNLVYTTNLPPYL